MAVLDTAAAPAQFGVGRVFTRTFEVLGRNFLPYCGLALLTVVPTLTLAFFETRSFQRLAISGSTGSALAASIALMFASFVLWIVLNYILQAALVHGTITTLNGNPASIRECLSTATRSLPRLLGIGFLASIGIFLGMLLLVVPGIIFAMMWAVAVPVCVVEHKSISESFSRSVELTRGHRWAIFGIVLVIVIASGVAGFAIRPLSGLSILPTPAQNILPAFGLYWIATALLRTLTAAIGAVGAASIYYELRMIKEGVGPEQLAAVFA